MPTDGQLISLLSHTLGSIGQVLKHDDPAYMCAGEKEIMRIYNAYIAIIKPTFK